MDNKIIDFTSHTAYIKEIITDYDALSIRCDEIDLTKKNTEVQEIILSLKQTMRNDESILALSANQVGYNKRILCMNFNGDIRSFINPIITKVEGFELSREKCHSIPNKEFIRPRHNNIFITYQTPLAKIQSIQLVGLAAKLFQHHVDHLDGLLLNDVGLEIDENFDKATEEERNQIISMYLDSIDLRSDSINTDIEKDEEAKKISDGIKFIESVQKGETILEEVPWTEEEKKVYAEYINSTGGNNNVST